MGTFVTQEDEPELYDDKEPAPGLAFPQGLSSVHVPRAADFNVIKTALFDIRTEARSHVYNVKHYGAVGDGVTDDTAAIQTALDQLSGSSTTGAGASTGVVYFPRGEYSITSRLNIYSNASHSVRLMGDNAGAGPSGSILTWNGANDGTMMRMAACWQSRVEYLVFNLNAKADIGLHLDTLQDTGGNGTSTTRIQHCKFGDCRNTTSQFISMGRSAGGTYQVDQMTISECWFTGGATPKGVAIKQLQGGNTKNLTVNGGTMVLLDVGVDNKGGGAVWWANTKGAEIGTVYKTAGGCIDTLQSVQIEGCGQFVDGASGTSASCLTVIGCEAWLGIASAPSDDDDTVIQHTGGILNLIGNKFHNTQVVAAWAASTAYPTAGVRRKNDSDKVYELIGASGTFMSAGSGGPTGTSNYITDNELIWRYVGVLTTDEGRVPRVICGGATVNASATSIGNYYHNAQGYAPLYDSVGGNNVLGADLTNSYAQVSNMRAMSLNDIGGSENGDGVIALEYAIGKSIAPNHCMLQPGSNTPTILGNGELGAQWSRFEFTYDDFTAAAHNAELLVNYFPDCFVHQTLMKVTTAFVGTGLTTCTAKLSTSANGSEIIAATSVLATATIGADPAELNSAAGKFWDASTLTNGARYKTSGSGVLLRIDGDVNLSLLTAGKIVVMINWSRID